MRRIIYDGDCFYEIDEECLKRKEKKEQQKKVERQKNQKDDGENGRKTDFRQ